jgi:hypothetical protein
MSNKRPFTTRFPTAQTPRNPSIKIRSDEAADDRVDPSAALVGRPVQTRDDLSACKTTGTSDLPALHSTAAALSVGCRRRPPVCRPRSLATMVNPLPITMGIYYPHIATIRFSIRWPVVGPGLRVISRTKSSSQRNGRQHFRGGNEGGYRQAGEHRFGQHGYSPLSERFAPNDDCLVDGQPFVLVKPTRGKAG